MSSRTSPDRVSPRGVSAWRVVGYVLAGGAAAALLISCGSSGQPGSTREAITTPSQPITPGSHRKASNEGRGRSARSLPTRSRPTSGSQQDKQSGCPSALSHAQCVAAGKAYERARSGGSQTVKPGKCPPALSHAQCVAAGKAYERARSGGSQTVKPGKCPPALSHAQCVAAGKAYERARSGSG